MNEICDGQSGTAMRTKAVIDQSPLLNKRLRNLADTFIPACLDDAGLTPREFRVFCRVARCGECYQSLDTMAKGCGLHRQTVQSALKLLVKSGFIECKEQPGRPSLYRVARMTPQKKTYRSKTYTSKPATMVPSGCKVPSLKRKETGASASLQRPVSFSDASKKPDSVHELLIHALTRCGFITSEANDWLQRVDLNVPAFEILEAIQDDALREALTLGFRFLHWNNRKGWKLENDWRAAFEGFNDVCYTGGCGDGPANVPRDWITHIAGVDGWPPNESDLIPD